MWIHDREALKEILLEQLREHGIDKQLSGEDLKIEFETVENPLVIAELSNETDYYVFSTSSILL